MPSFELIITAFLAISLTASIISSRTRTPYTIVLVLFGLAIAGSYLPGLLGVNLLYDSLIGGGLFVGLVLPQLLFETMMNIRYEDLRAVVRPALRLATVGVVIATIVGGLFLWQIARLPLTSSFIFASLIAPTDTATVLEIFRRARLPRKLSTLMETEAAFNDATGIAIFTIVITSYSVSQLSLFRAATSFATILGGGVLVVLARVATVYRLLGPSKVDTAPIPRSCKNVALLAGMKGALSIALAASLPANTPSRDLITSTVLGVAFLSITLQGFLLSHYTARRFPRKPSGGIQTVLSAKR